MAPLPRAGRTAAAGPAREGALQCLRGTKGGAHPQEKSQIPGLAWPSVLGGTEAQGEDQASRGHTVREAKPRRRLLDAAESRGFFQGI